MKKGLKITLITLVSVTGVALAVFFTLGGLPYKKLAEDTCENVNVTASPYPYAELTAPDDFETVERDGISLLAPAGLHPKDDSDPESISSRVYIRESDSTNSVMVLEPYDFGPIVPEELEIINDFAASIGRPAVENWCDYFDLNFHFTLDDCSIHSLRKAWLFYSAAHAKMEIVPVYQDQWEVQIGDGKGYIHLMSTPEMNPDRPRYKILVQLFYPDNLNVSHDLMITAADLETCCQIANSIVYSG